ncbi:MAG: photosystem II stability/assembly factor-like uncharacterized protein [Gammaproteobacteria bacterium]|jgi:photosystem II stability/assembly factor-like uncharacterized protein
MQKLPALISRFAQQMCFIFSVSAIFLLPVSVQAEDDSTIAKLAGKSMLLDGVSKDGLMAVVGERGHVLISTDGKQWQQVTVPTRTTLTGVYFHDKMNGWVVGHDAVILRTTDGGKVWQKVNYDPEGETPLFDVWFKNKKQGVAIGAYGLYLISGDGGVTWDESEINTSLGKSADDSDREEPTAEDDDDFLDSYDLHLNSIAIASNGRAYIAAESGKVYRSEDSGDSWIPLATPYIGSFFGILPVTGDTILVFGLRGHLFRSEDAGDHWQEIETPTQEMLTNGIAVTEDEIYITGLGGTILKSNDKGKSFTLIEQGHRDGFTAIIQSHDGNLITIGEKGVGLLQ